jgi:hypothetical protein
MLRVLVAQEPPRMTVSITEKPHCLYRWTFGFVIAQTVGLLCGRDPADG